MGTTLLSIDRASNRARNCAHCGIVINAYTDSGWEAFVGDGTQTQPLCIKCDLELDEQGDRLKVDTELH